MKRLDAEALALRRRLLIVDAAIQRKRLRRDVERLLAAADPAALAGRAWGRLRGRPMWIALAPVVLWLLRRPGLRRIAARLLALWPLWRRLRAWLGR